MTPAIFFWLCTFFHFGPGPADPLPPPLCQGPKGSPYECAGEARPWAPRSFRPPDYRRRAR